MADRKKIKDNLESFSKLSLGISMVVAILMGVGLGLLLKSWFEQDWLLWLGVFYGVAAAMLNVQKEYKKLKKDMDKVAQDPKYKNYMKNNKDDEDED
ncbi:MAG: AtpZ/AtpI family protein [Campylobacterales bacterium]|nr:AtpZ/AtpI family protein [Campylobacterales bacterium]